MRRRLLQSAVWTSAAAAGLACLAWLGLGEFAFNDYDNEARPAVEALVHGHFGSFLTLAPTYGGSLLERAPFALAAAAWGGGELAVYRMMALPCLLAAGALGLWLVAWMRRDEQTPLARAIALLLCVASPLTLLALEIGHPDELLGGALCVAAVLLAARGRAAWAGLALGAAIANKEWAAIALGAVLLALPARRGLCVAVAAATVAALLAPFALATSGGFLAGLHTTATSAGAAGAGGTSFQPWQWWWFFGATAHAADPAQGIVAGARLAPGWVESIGHQLIVALAVPFTLAAWLALRRTGAGGAQREHVALALLALLLLERCTLDPWDNVYYPIPFVLALLAWEATARKRPALLALACTLAIWADHGQVGAQLSPDGQSLVFLLVTLPMALLLVLAACAPEALQRLAHRRELLGQRGQPLAAAVTDHHQILDPHAEPAR